MNDIHKLLIVTDSTGKCWDPGMPQRKLNNVNTIVVHRVDEGETAEQIKNWFAQAFAARLPGVASGVMPYHFVIRRSGEIEQALPLATKSPHAANWNSRGIGVAVIGDFRKHRPTDEQRYALIAICRRIMDYMGRPLTIVGHTSLPDATQTPGKVCPGPLLSTEYTAQQVRACGHLRRE